MPNDDPGFMAPAEGRADATPDGRHGTVGCEIVECARERYIDGDLQNQGLT